MKAFRFAVDLALKIIGVEDIHEMVTVTSKAEKMDEQQKSLLQQHEAICAAARKLLDIAEKIYTDFENCPTWDDVDKYWKATEVADSVNRSL